MEDGSGSHKKIKGASDPPLDVSIHIDDARRTAVTTTSTVNEQRPIQRSDVGRSAVNMVVAFRCCCCCLPQMDCRTDVAI